jgi:hypothetical protein
MYKSQKENIMLVDLKKVIEMQQEMQKVNEQLIASNNQLIADNATLIKSNQEMIDGNDLLIQKNAGMLANIEKGLAELKRQQGLSVSH